MCTVTQVKEEAVHLFCTAPCLAQLSAPGDKLPANRTTVDGVKVKSRLQQMVGCRAPPGSTD